MIEKPRRWFQFHLSTAVVMMIVAGGLVYVNVTPRTTLRDGETGDVFSSLSRKWPSIVVYPGTDPPKPEVVDLTKDEDPLAVVHFYG